MMRARQPFHARRVALAPLVLGLACCAPADPDQADEVNSSEQPLIFATDDRQNVEDILGDDQLRRLSDGVVLLGPINKDVAQGHWETCAGGPGDFCALQTVPARADPDTVLLDTNDTPRLGLCDDQLYSDEEILHSFGQCTGFWLGGQVFATAGHCVKADNDPEENLGRKCSNTQVVFDFDVASFNTATGRPNITIIKKRASTIYKCAQVLGNVALGPSSSAQGSNEWTIFKVDRPVTGHRPLRARKTGGPSVNDPLVVIGHGLRMPKKIDDGALVREVTTGQTFRYSGDIFLGNSGGPIIDLATGLVEGIATGTPSSAMSLVSDASGSCSRYTAPCSVNTGCSGTTTKWPTAAALNQSAITALLPAEATSLSGDFDLDGKIDSVSVKPNLFGTLDVTITASSAGTTYSFPTLIPSSFNALGTLNVGDFNGDGYYDVLAHAAGFPQLYVDGGALLTLNVPNTAFINGVNSKTFTVRDLNSDEVEDLVVQSSSGTTRVFLGGPSLAGSVAAPAGGLAPVLEIPLECGTGPIVKANAQSCGNTECFDSLTDYRTTRAVAVVPGSVAGLSDAPSLLAIDCPGSPPGAAQKNQILLLDPRDGSKRATIPLKAGGKWRAFAYRASSQDLVGLESDHLSSLPYRVHKIDIKPGAQQGTVTQLLADYPAGGQIATGVGWDGSASTIQVLMDPNTAPSGLSINVYNSQGAFVKGRYVDFTAGCPPVPEPSPPGIQPHGGGLLIAGSNTAVACNVMTFGIPFFNARTTILPVALNSDVTPKPFFQSMLLHDLECDPVTYTSVAKTVVWGVARGGRALRAFDYPNGGCGLGGESGSKAADWAGYEDSSKPWSSPDTAVVLNTESFTDGTHSLSISGPGRTRLLSPVFGTAEWTAIGTALSIDVRVPPGKNAVSGHVKFVFSAPSAGLVDVHLGTVLLKDLVPGVWTEITVPVDPAVQAALDDVHSDAQFLLDIHTKVAQPVLFDRLRFTGEIRVRSAFP